MSIYTKLFISLLKSDMGASSGIHWNITPAFAADQPFERVASHDDPRWVDRAMGLSACQQVVRDTPVQAVQQIQLRRHLTTLAERSSRSESLAVFLDLEVREPVDKVFWRALERIEAGDKARRPRERIDRLEETSD